MASLKDSRYRRAIDYACFVVLLAVFAGAMVRRIRRPVSIDSAVPISRHIDLEPGNEPDPDADTAAMAPSREEVTLRIDPNVATWWELAELPGIGETKARAIIAYREQFRSDALHDDPDAVPPPAFANAEDLDNVKGIGPVTVEKMRPLLLFDQAGGRE